MSKSSTNLLSLIIISVAIYFVIISPIYFGGGSLYSVSPDESIVSMREFKNKIGSSLKELNDGKLNIAKLDSEYGSLDKDTQDKLNTMIPNDVDPIRLVSEINKIVTGVGLTAENISYSKEPEDKNLPGIGIYSISFSTKSSYSNLKNLIDKLEKSRRIFSIQSVSFASGTNINDPMNVNIKMNTYYIK